MDRASSVSCCSLKNGESIGAKLYRSRSRVAVFGRAKLLLSRTCQPCFGLAGASPSRSGKPQFGACGVYPSFPQADGCAVGFDSKLSVWDVVHAPYSSRLLNNGRQECLPHHQQECLPHHQQKCLPHHQAVVFPETGGADIPVCRMRALLNVLLPAEFDEGDFHCG